MKMDKQPHSAGIAWYKGQLLNKKTFANHVMHTRCAVQHRMSTRNTAQQKLLNVCDDHYHFLVLFVAAMLEGLVTLMPANRSDGELLRLHTLNPGLLEIGDPQMAVLCDLHGHSAAADNPEWDIHLIDPAKMVAEIFTSGSTGTPAASPKTWGQLLNGAQQVLVRFGVTDAVQHHLVTTVPPQHMFGFEMSIVLPLVGNVSVYHRRPFYPLDIQHALHEVPEPRVLVTTPLHLKTCTVQETVWPRIAFIISATATMPVDVATKVEAGMLTELHEIYGCSEAGAIATRRVLKNPGWKLLESHEIGMDSQGAWLKTLSPLAPVYLPDCIEILPDGLFRLVGRVTDLIKIGGKRGSLADVTARIKALHGVEDAIVFVPQADEGQRVRLAALVVAPGMVPERLRELLARDVDSIFLPRPICIVAALPYTNTGKLVHATLMSRLECCQGS